MTSSSSNDTPACRNRPAGVYPGRGIKTGRRIADTLSLAPQRIGVAIQFGGATVTGARDAIRPYEQDGTGRPQHWSAMKPEERTEHEAFELRALTVPIASA